MLQVGNLTFWITAGHVLEDVLRLRDEPSVKIVSAAWNDGYENKHADGVLFSLDDVPAYIDPNIDFGAIVIRPGYARPLLANPQVRPMTPNVWLDHENANPEGYYLVGVPTEWTDYEEVGRTEKERIYSSGARIVCIPVERIPWASGKEPKDFWDDPDAFYAKLLDVWKSPTEKLTSIKGMSGGPIVSIERTPDSELKYRLYGIQSAWLPKSRILRAEPVAKVAAIIRDWFDKAALATADRNRNAPRRPWYVRWWAGSGRKNEGIS